MRIDRDHREKMGNNKLGNNKIDHKKVIDKKNTNESSKTLDCHEAALQFLSRRDRSTHEVRQHLTAKGFDREAIKDELETLKDFRYLDDVRYCENYFRYAIAKGRGPGRITAELKEKGIDSALIQDFVNKSFDKDAEKEAAMKEAQKILRSRQSFGTMVSIGCGNREDHMGGYEEEALDCCECGEEARTEIDDKTVAKIGRKLASLGYRADVIYDIMGRIRKSEE